MARHVPTPSDNMPEFTRILMAGLETLSDPDFPEVVIDGIQTAWQYIALDMGGQEYENEGEMACEWYGVMWGFCAGRIFGELQQAIPENYSHPLTTHRN